MLGTTNLTDPHDVEQLRRSVAMLAPNDAVTLFTRAEALALLSALHRALVELADNG